MFGMARQRPPLLKQRGRVKTLNRLSRMTSSSAARLSTESATARTERLASTASIMSARRARLSVEERSLQNSQDAVRVARLRASKSPVQKTLRRTLGLQPPLELRNNPKKPLFRNTLSTASARALESPAQTTVRRVRNARSTASAKAAENSEVRRQRLENISQLRASLNGVTLPSASFWSNVAYNYDCTVNYSARRNVQIGAMDKVFTFCNAKKWAGEQPGLCCSGGKIKLPSLDEPPQPLRDLFLDTTSESTHFLEAIRKYNCCFQMTSFGAKAIIEGVGWMPTFKMQGHVYHLMGSLLADQREPPQFLQIYFLADYNEQVDARLGILPSDISIGPSRDILFRLQDMLHETNSYIRSLKFALQNKSSPSFSVVIDFRQTASRFFFHFYQPFPFSSVLIIFIVFLFFFSFIIIITIIIIDYHISSRIFFFLSFSFIFSFPLFFRSFSLSSYPPCSPLLYCLPLLPSSFLFFSFSTALLLFSSFLLHVLFFFLLLFFSSSLSSYLTCFSNFIFFFRFPSIFLLCPSFILLQYALCSSSFYSFPNCSSILSLFLPPHLPLLLYSAPFFNNLTLLF
ncbi:unnamed protein product [Acanthosepion pharaonis]|uniref:Helitron helicase-like domain-containing protein n=1 Tax=Acanthosepion pharaonis TaxID=158019 RepID=A0A812BTM8_ACAPH|nr:unnamed protein product [Sepia pharaonis]